MNEDVAVIITTMDNLPILRRQIDILSEEVGDIYVVNNGSIDETGRWLAGNYKEDCFINRENFGAGPGRNAGLDLWNMSTPYVLMVDGGILPPHGAVSAMKAWLERNPNVHVLAPEVATCFTDDEDEATRRMPEISDDATFAQTVLSGTAFALCRAKAWDGIRFSEEGPFGEPGWGCDDNDMQFRWNDARILHHDFGKRVGAKFYRRGSGSFQRLYKETGVWPNQYGSVYEKRHVKLHQDWRHYYDPFYNTYKNIKYSLITQNLDYPEIAYVCKALHDFYGGNGKKISHEVIVGYGCDRHNNWLYEHALRWPWGNTTVSKSGTIIRRNEENEKIWTGDIQIDTVPRGEHVITVGREAAKRLLTRLHE
jgi:glycosyltransferase involved in cell wall biosynthesis